MAHSISRYDEDNPMLRIVVDDYEVFGMTLTPVQESHHQWLCEILDRAFTDAIEKAVRRARAKDQAELRRLLGI